MRMVQFYGTAKSLEELGVFVTYDVHAPHGLGGYSKLNHSWLLNEKLGDLIQKFGIDLFSIFYYWTISRSSHNI